MEQNSEKVDWLADVEDFVKTLRDDIERIAGLTRNLQEFGDDKKERDEKRLKRIEEDKLVLPVQFPEIARMIGEMENSHREFVDYVDQSTTALEGIAKGLNRLLANRMFQHPLAFAQLQKWETLDYMDKLLWHIYSRGPISEADLRDRMSPFSDNMFNDCLRTLKGVGEVVEVDIPTGDGHMERALKVPEGVNELRLINVYLWKHRRAGLSDAAEIRRQAFTNAYLDLERDDGSSAVFAAAIAEILDQPNLALTLGAITYHFNKRFNKALKESGKDEIKRSEGRIRGILEDLEAKGFVTKIQGEGKDEKWVLDREAYANPEAHRVRFKTEKTPDD